MEGNKENWNPKLIGILIGLALGAILVFAGALNAFFVALLVVAGWLVGKYVAGEIDLDDLYDRYIRGRTKGRR